MPQSRLLQAPWPAPANIHTLITTIAADFNLATHVGDLASKVTNNRQWLNRYLPAPPLWLNQTHSNDIIDWTSPSASIPNADGSISWQEHQVCVVLTADCLPILFTTTTGAMVAAIHAGWRGLVNGIVEAGLNKLAQVPAAQILAFIGPAIGQECFEVGAEVRQAFITQAPDDAQYFILTDATGHKFKANLRQLAVQRLLRHGVLPQHISAPAVCTQCTAQWFFSYRGNPHCGRFATLIWKSS